MKKKTIALVLACILCVGIGIGGTLAWLTDKTDSVTNTFTTSDIDITLEETKGGENKEFKMVPGYTIEKDPKVTVTAGSEDCYLFVKLEKSANFDSFMTYEMAGGWTQLKDASDVAVPGVFYRVVHAADMGTAFSVLKNDQVKVLDSVTKANMNGLTANTYPTLTVTAYASQLYQSAGVEFPVATAWTNAQPTT